jgi:type IV secretory pathway VirB6-like protein
MVLCFEIVVTVVLLYFLLNYVCDLHIAVDGVEAVAKRLDPKHAVQKKFTAKPKPVEVIEISYEKDNEEKVQSHITYI